MLVIKRVPLWNSGASQIGEGMENGKETARNSKVYLSYLLTLKCRKVFVCSAKLRENDNANIFVMLVGCVSLTTSQVGSWNFAQVLKKKENKIENCSVRNFSI